MNFVTFSQLNADIIRCIGMLPREIDLVVGIPRSGMLVANMISLYLNKPLCDIDSFLERTVYRSGSTKSTARWKIDFREMRNVLVVEDSVCSGKSILAAKERIEAACVSDKKMIYLAAYVWKKDASFVDCYFRAIDLPRAFEWNYLHIKLLESTCFDIDGVLCEDPTPEQNDDGVRYLEFLRNATPKFLPTQKIGCIVTSRLEKYRKETEEWLSTHGIEYNALYMMNVASAEKRRKMGNHAEFKAKVYKQRNNMIFFVESEERQAADICRISGKAVFCPTNQRFYDESVVTKSANWIKSFLYPYVPRFLLALYRKMKRWAKFQ